MKKHIFRWMIVLAVVVPSLLLLTMASNETSTASGSGDVVYIPQDSECWVCPQGYVYEVYNTKGELYEITLKDCVDGSGFYRVVTNENGVPVLNDISTSAEVKANQTFRTIYKNLLFTDGIDHYDMTNAVIVDTRSEIDIEWSEIYVLETAMDFLCAKNIDGAGISMDVLVDTTDNSVEIIFVTEAIRSDSVGSGSGSGEPREGTLVTVTQVNNTIGAETITVYGVGKLENNAVLDQVTEYEGVCVGDIAICMYHDGKLTLFPTTTVEGQILRTWFNDGNYYITMGDTDYKMVNHPNMTTLLKSISQVDFSAKSRLYLAQDGTCVGFEAIADYSDYKELENIIYTIAGYEVITTNQYGMETCTFYAQGVDINGMEVSYIVGIAKEDTNDADGDGNTGWDILYDCGIEELGLSYDPAAPYGNHLTGDLLPGFYYVKKSYDMDAAAMGVMIPYNVSTEFDPQDTAAVVAQKAAVGNGVALTDETLYVVAGGETAYLTEDTRYVAYNGSLADLEVKAFDSGISYTFNGSEQADLLLTKDKNDNVIARAIFISAAPEEITPATVYQISVDSATNGTVTVDKTSGPKGKVVTVTATPDNGYELAEILVDNIAIKGNTFTISGEHTVTAIFTKRPIPAGTITDTGRSISLGDQIYINQYITISGFEGIDVAAKGGLLIWNSEVTEKEAVYGTADTTQAGLIAYGDEYTQRTLGISAKNYADELYLRVYVEVAEGVYEYGPLVEYSVQDYCEHKIATDGYSTELKKTCAALLHYGAMAQRYFNYNTTDLANANILEVYPAPAWMTEE